MVRVCSFVGLVAAACASPAVVGGETAPAGREPAGRPIASYRVTACVDAAGGAFDHSARAVLSEGAGKERVLVVTRPSYDSLVLTPPRTEGSERVFQVILEDGDGARILHDFRVPVSGSGEGRMAVSREFAEDPSSVGHVSARVGRIAFACKLSPEGAP